MLGKANTTLLQAIQQAAKNGSVIEAKFELDDSGALSLSTYTAQPFIGVYVLGRDGKSHHLIVPVK